MLSRIFTLFIFCVAFGSVQAAPTKIVAEFTEALPTPVNVNKFYECSLRVDNLEGAGVPELRLQIRGRMPEHSHGLPTEPQIIEEGQGRYRIKGLSFNMPGRWVIEILHDDKLLIRQELTVRH